MTVVDLPAAPEAPEDASGACAGPVAAVALELRRCAYEWGISRSHRETLNALADQLDGCAYTADVAAAVAALIEVGERQAAAITNCADVVEAQGHRIEAMATASGFVGAKLGELLDQLGQVRRLGYRGWRKAQG